MKTAISAVAFATVLSVSSGKTITVSAGDDFEAVCLYEVEAGDTCILEEGDYEHDGLTRVHGTADAPITITGEDGACIKGSGTQDRVLQIAHDYYIIDNLCFDGTHGDEYASTAIYVLGADEKSTKNGVTSSVTGLQLTNLDIRNFDEECIHFRYFVTHAEVTGCTIQNCGRYSFESGGGGKVGEGIYVGTALDQVDDNKAPEVKLRSGSADNVDADICRDNWIHHNTFRTYANECVDVKEGSTNNLIEYNVCEQQQDENSGCFGFRGSENTGRYNEIAECVGAGFRVGGDKGYGEGNNMYGNIISNADYGAFNVMSPDQGVVCGNQLSGITTVVQGSDKDTLDGDSTQADCSGSLPGDIEDFSSPSPTPTPPSSTPTSDDDGEAEEVTLEEDTDDGNGAGVNFSEDADSDYTIDEITTNANAGEAGEGSCAMVLKVEKAKVEHAVYADPDTSVDNLFDDDLETYYSINRESTTITFELEEDIEINGVTIGFFMKEASEERIQTFDIAVRNSEDSDWKVVISRKESSGAMLDMQYFAFSSKTAKYVRFESHGNTFNNWTALTEMQICAKDSSESNAMFDGIDAANKELQKLSDSVCESPTKMSAAKVKVDGSENVSVLFDGSFDTRWSTDNTYHSDDLDNDKITIRYDGEKSIAYVKIAFFDGHLAKPHFSIYSQRAKSSTWESVLDNEIAAKTEIFQTFYLQKEDVKTLYIVGNGNDVGDYTKVSEVEVYGC